MAGGVCPWAGDLRVEHNHSPGHKGNGLLIEGSMRKEGADPAGPRPLCPLPRSCNLASIERRQKIGHPTRDMRVPNSDGVTQRRGLRGKQGSRQVLRTTASI